MLLVILTYLILESDGRFSSFGTSGQAIHLPRSHQTPQDRSEETRCD